MNVVQDSMEWIKGKPGGTIFQRKSGDNAYNVEPKVTK